MKEFFKTITDRETLKLQRERMKSFLRQNIIRISFLIGAILAVDKSSLVSLIWWIWVNPIAIHLTNPWPIYLLMVIILFGFWKWTKRRKDNFMLFLLIGTIVLIGRTFDQWAFIANSYMLPCLLLLVYLINRFWDSEKKAYPVFSIPKDQFKRDDFAQSILKVIKNKEVDTKRGSYNFGIIGSFGSGKTHLIKNLMNKMSSDSNFITYYYKPWESISEHDFLANILAGLSKASEDTSIQSHIKTLLSKIETDSDNTWLKIFSFIYSYLIGAPPSIEEAKAQLEEEIINSQKKIIVFLDDLDRLQKSEILEVLRLLRTTLDITNLFFIIGFDDEYVMDTLGYTKDEPNRAKSFTNYISKYFQVKVHLPIIEQDRLLKKYIHDEFERVFIQHDISFSLFEDSNWSEIESFENLIGKEIIETIKTPRDFECIINTFDLSHENLRNNCNPFTLLQLEIIRQTHPNLYTKIRQNYYTIFVARTYQHDTEVEKRIINTISSHSHYYNYSIKEPKYCTKYFTLTNGDFEIDQTDFEEFLSKDPDTIDQKVLDSWLDQGKYEDYVSKLKYFVPRYNDITAKKLLSIDRTFPRASNTDIGPVHFIVPFLNNKLSKDSMDPFFQAIKDELQEDRIYHEITYFFFIYEGEELRNKIYSAAKRIYLGNHFDIDVALGFKYHLPYQLYNEEYQYNQNIIPEIWADLQKMGQEILKIDPIKFFELSINEYREVKSLKKSFKFSGIFNVDVDVDDLNKRITESNDQNQEKAEEYGKFLNLWNKNPIKDIPFKWKHHPFYSK